MNSFFIKNGVSITFSNHTVLQSYTNRPPRKYVNKFFSKLHHFINHVPKNYKKPFIIEFEHFLIFCHYKDYRNYKKMLEGVDNAKKILESDLCKAIIIWSNGALRELKKYIDTSTIDHKIHIIRPSIKNINTLSRNDNKNFIILNIANRFWSKGTFMVIDAFKMFHKKYNNSKLNLICNDVPKDYIIPTGIVLNNNSKLPIAEKSRLFNNSDIFLHPTLQDAYGVYIESLAYGLPTISSSIYDKDEVILDNICGVLVNSPFSWFESNIGVEFATYADFVKIIQKKYANGEFDDMIYEIYQKLEYLYLNKTVLNKMRLNCKNHFKTHFSLENRNKKVNEIYEKALKELS